VRLSSEIARECAGGRGAGRAGARRRGSGPWPRASGACERGPGGGAWGSWACASTSCA